MEKSRKEIKGIMHEIEYGNINVKLDKLLNDRNISTYELSNKANVRFQTIQNLRNNQSIRIDFNVLAKICYVLECKVEDIIEYQENKSK